MKGGGKVMRLNKHIHTHGDKIKFCLMLHGTLHGSLPLLIGPPHILVVGGSERANTAYYHQYVWACSGVLAVRLDM